MERDRSRVEFSRHVKPGDIGASSDGDFWRLYVEVETNSPDCTRLEIEKAICRQPTAAQFGLMVEHGYILTGEEFTSDNVGDWVMGQRPQEPE